MIPIGVVVIGRNEGERLVNCLKSLLRQNCEKIPIIYVDSGSSDGSCEKAQELGVEVVNLDLSTPFTAARARNAGFTKLRENHPEVIAVQFLDGDCEMLEGWLSSTAKTIEENPDVVAVCGFREERYPEKSVYNRICNVEWQMGKIGEILNFGGDVMIRAETLAAIGGYNEKVIAAEDDEVSIRLRQTGGKIVRLAGIRVIHDANMHNAKQWWQRAKRSGYGFAQVAYLHGKSPEQKFLKELRRTWLWGMIVPVIAIALVVVSHGLSLLLFLRYPLTAIKVIYQSHKQGFTWKDSLAWGISCSLSAFPAVLGTIRFYWDLLNKKQHTIIEYKTARAAS